MFSFIKVCFRLHPQNNAKHSDKFLHGLHTPVNSARRAFRIMHNKLAAKLLRWNCFDACHSFFFHGALPPQKTGLIRNREGMDRVPMSSLSEHSNMQKTEETTRTTMLKRWRPCKPCQCKATCAPH